MTDPATVEAPEPEEPDAPARADQVLADLGSADAARSAVVATNALKVAATSAPSHSTSASYAPLESDHPTLEDAFDRGALVDRIYQIVTQEKPLGTIGIYGSWGSGKSSIMRQVHERLETGWHDRDGQRHPGYFEAPTRAWTVRRRKQRDRGTVWFSAWEHQQDVDPAIAMLQDARRLLRPSWLNRWRMKRWFNILRDAIGTGGDTLEQMGRPGRALAAVGAPLAVWRQSAERVNRDLFAVQEDQVRKKEAFTEIVRLLARRNTQHRVVFFVDDLDRCDDAVAQRLLDDIKTYLDQEQCVFVIGVNSARLRAGHDQAIPGEDRLAKIIQYPFYVPMLEKDQYRRYLEQSLRDKFLAPTATGRATLEEVQIRAVAELLTDALAARSTSLREVKRLLNVFTVNHQLASRAFGETGLWGVYQPLVVAVLSAVQAFCPATFEWLSGRSDAPARMAHLFAAAPVPDPPPSEALDELDGTSILAAARRVGSNLADETRLTLYLTMWGQTHQSTVRHDSRWTREWRARSDLTLPEVQRWIQGIGADGQIEHEWTDDDLRVVKLGDWWWWVLDIRPASTQPPLPHRTLLLSEGIVTIRPYTGHVDDNGYSDFPDYSRWLAAEPDELPGVLWSQSSLRQWLREDFRERIPGEVRERIVMVSAQTETAWAGSRGILGNIATEDSRRDAAKDDPTDETVHLLARDQIFGGKAEYPLGRVDVDARSDGGVVGFWWLRSPGYRPHYAWAVLPSSLAGPDHHNNNLWAGSRAGVRPVFWLDLEY
ncbi:MAG: KAP family NTPase [Micrococcales bacterium]|nr:KAP family NTPase [Micrococcales bacterium]